MDEDDKGPIDRVADLVLFGPLGLMLDARDQWPNFVRRGRRQLGAARGRGGDAFGRGRTWASDRVGDVQDQAGSALRGLGLASGGDNGSDARAAGPRQRPPTPSRPEPQAGPTVEVGDLAVPDYDALSASQVVPRLAGLSEDELEDVRRYEAGTRGRKTILNKIAQLQTR